MRIIEIVTDKMFKRWYISKHNQNISYIYLTSKTIYNDDHLQFYRFYFADKSRIELNKGFEQLLTLKNIANYSLLKNVEIEKQLTKAYAKDLLNE